MYPSIRGYGGVSASFYTPHMGGIPKSYTPHMGGIASGDQDAIPPIWGVQVAGLYTPPSGGYKKNTPHLGGVYNQPIPPVYGSLDCIPPIRGV
jgi:hypothetical protein